MTNLPRYDFSGISAIVTGGAGGIGASIAEALARYSAVVHVLDSEMAESNSIHYHQVDIRNPEQISDAISKISEPATLLVNNAGITRDRSLRKMSGSEWQDVLDVNLTGAFNMIQATVPAMIAAGGGRIVNIASINGLRGKFGQANYAAAKAGLLGLTKTAAREFGDKGITVNAVAPGMVLTDMALALPAKFRELALNESTLKKLAEPGDIAQAVLFLLSDAARMITGEVVRVDAGQYI